LPSFAAAWPPHGRSWPTPGPQRCALACVISGAALPSSVARTHSLPLQLSLSRPPWNRHGRAGRLRVPLPLGSLMSIRVRHRLRRPPLSLARPSPAFLRRRSAWPPVPWPPRMPVRAARPTWPASGLDEQPHASALALGCSPAASPTPTTTTATRTRSSGEVSCFRPDEERSRTTRMNLIFSRGLSDESVTHLNSAVKDLFVRV